MSASTRLTRRRVLIVAVAVAALAGAFAFPGFANLSGSNFEGDDGNLARTLDAPSIDWCSKSQAELDAVALGGVCPAASEAPNLASGLDLASGSHDDAFTNGTKQDDDPPSVGTGGIPPNKDDLTRFYIAHDSNSTTSDSYVYLGWERNPSNSASAHEGFEFNKKRCTHVNNVNGPDCSANHVTPTRSAGDLLIVYDFEGGSSAPTLSTRRWILSGSCEVASDSAPCWGQMQDLSANDAEALTNNADSVVDPINPNAPRTITTNGFGEAAVNLTDSGILPSTGPCVGFGSAYVVSRSSGNSAKSTMKDFIAPIPVEINNCQPATITVRKTNSSGGLAGATIHLVNDQAPPDAGHSVFDGLSVDTDATIDASSTSADPCTTPASGVCSWTVTGSGASHYLVVETAAPAGYTGAASPIHVDVTFTSTAQTIDLGDILNTPAPRDVVVKKVDDDSPAVGVGGVVFKAVKDDADDSAFGDAERTAYASASVKTCTTASAGTSKGTCTLSGLDAGPNIHWYIVEDSRPAGYGDDTSKATCTTVAAVVGPPAVPQVDKRCVRIAVPTGSTPIAVSADTTFTNPRLFKVIVLVCDKSTNQLYASKVQFDAESAPTNPNSLAHSATLPGTVTEGNLCSLGGATHDNVNYGDHTAPHINIGQ